MGIFSKKDAPKQANEAPTKEKKSLYQRWQDKKSGQPISDEELQKHLGMNRDELQSWSESQPGVGKNQLAGSAGKGHMSGLGGVAMADGFGGWGTDAEHNDQNRGMKFPPKKDDEAAVKEGSDK